MAKDIAIDPITMQEFNNAVSKSYNELTEELDHEAVKQMETEDALQMFFANGFLYGCIAMTDNPDLQETLYMMTKEIDYQTK